MEPASVEASVALDVVDAVEAAAALAFAVVSAAAASAEAWSSAVQPELLEQPLVSRETLVLQ